MELGRSLIAQDEARWVVRKRRLEPILLPVKEEVGTDHHWRDGQA